MLKYIPENRSFKKLRVSLTDVCNLACTYCVSEEHALTSRKNQIVLEPDEFITIIKQLHESLDLRKVRLTGGEPLMYPKIVELTKGIKALGINDIGLTTNGYYLKHLAGKLK